ncbi:MAG: 4-hydroxyphenylpyruvate dioxygenase [Sphingobacteriia bacterium]|nr:4-hydroxyphenylpyruvate dioxygenase [Sphingobacteriia bacterium]
MIQEDFLPLNGTDHLEFYVGNAKQAAYFYKTAFGFQDYAYAGPETGVKEKSSYVIKQGKIILVLTTPLQPEHEINDHIRQHGDGVKVLALGVEDATRAYEETVKRGAKGYLSPQRMSDEHGEIVTSGIHTYGDTVHLFVERKNYRGPFMPGFQAYNSGYHPTQTGLLHVDHCVGNVDWGQMNIWCEFYKNVMGFKQIISFDDKDISTEYSALMSKVMSNGNGYVKFPINEPAEGKKKSQIEEYIQFYKGPGVQHIAVATGDIIHTVQELRSRGIDFLRVPDTYYETLLDRVGNIDEEVAILKDLGLLVDRDDEGYLLQIFTKPVEDRPTLFFEIIQRKGATSFGKGNFKALFESIELEQGRRGNL